MKAAGFTLLEVLITMIILVFGLLALANLQAKMNLTQMEAYQRAQAVVLLQDMMSRISNNRANVASYVSATPYGTPASGPVTVATCPTSAGAALDTCEWSNALLGAAETSGGGTKVGAMIGARGCVEQIQAPDPSAGVCQPGIYRVTVVWQGLNGTSSSAGLACGSGLYPPDDTWRRAISEQLIVGLPGCG